MTEGGTEDSYVVESRRVTRDRRPAEEERVEVEESTRESKYRRGMPELKYEETEEEAEEEKEEEPRY